MGFRRNSCLFSRRLRAAGIAILLFSHAFATDPAGTLAEQYRLTVHDYDPPVRKIVLGSDVGGSLIAAVADQTAIALYDLSSGALLWRQAIPQSVVDFDFAVGEFGGDNGCDLALCWNRDLTQAARDTAVGLLVLTNLNAKSQTADQTCELFGVPWLPYADYRPPLWRSRLCGRPAGQSGIRPLVLSYDRPATLFAFGTYMTDISRAVWTGFVDGCPPVELPLGPLTDFESLGQSAINGGIATLWEAQSDFTVTSNRYNEFAGASVVSLDSNFAVIDTISFEPDVSCSGDITITSKTAELVAFNGLALPEGEILVRKRLYSACADFPETIVTVAHQIQELHCYRVSGDGLFSLLWHRIEIDSFGTYAMPSGLGGRYYATLGSSVLEFDGVNDGEYVACLLPPQPEHLVTLIDDPVTAGKVWVVDIGSSGELVMSTIELATDESDTEHAPLPELFALSEPFPNPFNPSTTVQFDLPSREHVRMELFNSLGQSVALLADREFVAGSHQIVWDGCDRHGHHAASGIYLIRATTGSGRTRTVKAVLLR